MPRRHPPEALSPRALARLRASPRSYVPTELDLDVAHSSLVEHWPVRADAQGVDEHAGAVAPAGDCDGGRHARMPYPRRWVRLPAVFLGARWQPGRTALLGVVIVVALAAALFGVRVAWARSADGGTVIGPGGGSRAGPTGVTAGAVPVGVARSAATSSVASSVAPTSSTSARASPPLGVVVVHVVGRVRHPGVHRLPVGSRVADAVQAAGGASGKADLAALNLARMLVDGEQVRVPAVGDPMASPGPGPGSGSGSGTGGGGGAGAAGSSGTPVSLNTGDLGALDTLPGVGPVLAQRILDWRAAHGRFSSVDELGEVSGIGEKLLAQLGPLVTL